MDLTDDLDPELDAASFRRTEVALVVVLLVLVAGWIVIVLAALGWESPGSTLAIMAGLLVAITARWLVLPLLSGDRAKARRWQRDEHRRRIGLAPGSGPRIPKTDEWKPYRRRLDAVAAATMGPTTLVVALIILSDVTDDGLSKLGAIWTTFVIGIIAMTRLSTRYAPPAAPDRDLARAHVHELAIFWRAGLLANPHERPYTFAFNVAFGAAMLVFAGIYVAELMRT